ncbi:MAG TPA: hypothetical protein PKZ43_01000 [Bacteroidales bacterium]|nr:hypothetical protein [Bacteroidales bacterium]HQI45539.1 hypothetical protein [Bacteroidales bacterium]
MNKTVRIFVLLIITLSFLLIDTSCRSKKYCGGMKYYKKDVKRGLAH